MDLNSVFLSLAILWGVVLSRYHGYFARMAVRQNEAVFGKRPNESHYNLVFKYGGIVFSIGALLTLIATEVARWK